jgi:hypothetical protein
VAAFLALFHFAVPLLFLLGRATKRRKTFIGAIAVTVVLMRWVDTYWLIAPSFSPMVRIHWLDLVLWMVIGGIWLYIFLVQLMKRSLLPLRDPNFALKRAA